MMIYVITHKNFKPIVKSKLYKTLLVGADNNQGDKDYLRDNDFPGNLSSKNKNYCELTGVYWIWKRSKEDIVGICHYRRYFTTSETFKKSHIIDQQEQVQKILQNYDIIATIRNPDVYNGMTAKEHFCKNHDINVWNQCKKIIENDKPEYLEDYKWFEKQTTGFCFNMMISNKAIFDQYCEWLFSILFELEKKIDLSQYDAYNQRMFGFVSERLLNVWVHHHHLRVKELPVYLVDDRSFCQKVSDKLHRIVNSEK